MKDNKGNFIYFSSTGNLSYNSYRIKKYYKEKRPKKYYIRNNLINEDESNFFENEENKDIFLDNNIFNVSCQKNREETIENDNNIPFFINNKKNTIINKYKYYLKHLQKLRQLKKEKKLNNNKQHYYEQDYEPNIDFIKKRVIIGPKWDLITGRKDSLKNIKNNTISIKKSNSKKKNLVTENMNSFIKEKNIKINIKKHILKDISLKKKDYSYEKKLYNTKKKLKKNINSNNFNTTLMNNINNFNKKIKKKKIISKNKSMINFNLNSLKSKVFILDNLKINDKYLSKYISPVYKKIAQKKNKIKYKTDIKIYRNRNIGLNYEELKIINDIKKNKIKKLTKQNSKPNNLKIKNSKFLKKIKNESDEFKYYKINNYYYNNLSNIKKSYNSYINKSLLKYTEKNINSLILKNDNSKSF